MNYPWRCEGCGKQTMADLESLERREMDRIFSADGFVCGCGEWVAVFVSTRSLREAMKRLEGMDARRKDFVFHFRKALRKAQGVREKAQGSL